MLGKLDYFLNSFFLWTRTRDFIFERFGDF